VDVTKDVMHNIGKDLHVNVAGDIFYTGRATFQLQAHQGLQAKVDGDVSIEAAARSRSRPRASSSRARARSR
jgi:type VI secretion system secreted protein VgrG